MKRSLIILGVLVLGLASSLLALPSIDKTRYWYEKQVVHLILKGTENGNPFETSTPISPRLLSVFDNSLVLHLDGYDFTIGMVDGNDVIMTNDKIQKHLTNYLRRGGEMTRLTLSLTVSQFQRPSVEFERWKALPIALSGYKMALGDLPENKVELEGLEVAWSQTQVVVKSLPSGNAPLYVLDYKQGLGVRPVNVSRVFAAEGLLAVGVGQELFRQAQLYVYDLATGKLLWKTAPWAPVEYLEIRDGMLYAWHNRTAAHDFPEPLLSGFRARDGRPYWQKQVTVSELSSLLQARISDDPRAAARTRKFEALAAVVDATGVR